MIKIKGAREKLGISQCELAKRLSVCQSTVAMWENGTNTPTADKLPQLAKILNCTIDDLFSDENKTA